MTAMYMMTEAQHAQITEHYERLYAEIDLSEWDGKAARLLRDTLAMLKAMQPVSPSIYSITYAGAHVNNFHRVQENAEHEMRRLERNFPEPVGKRKVAALYTPTKD